jgi:hypothetical protein
MRPPQWPQPVRDRGVKAGNMTDWQQLLPPDGLDEKRDRELLALAYGDQDAARRRAAELAEQMSEREWLILKYRWNQIAQFQRQYLLNNPGEIADRCERQRWLSRLAVATPKPLVDIEYLRSVQQQSAPPMPPTPKGATKAAPTRRTLLVEDD